MKAIICGGRAYEFTAGDIAWLDALRESLPITGVMTGGASGADCAGKMWAIRNKIPSLQIRPDWRGHGKTAGPIRNAEMARWGDVCICFPGGRGTADMARQAKARGLRVIAR